MFLSQKKYKTLLHIDIILFLLGTMFSPLISKVITFLSAYKVSLIYVYWFSLIFFSHCQELSVNVTRGLLDSIQNEIQHKDDQMAWVDSCCLQLSLRNKDDTYTFQMDSPEARKEWITGILITCLS